MYIEKTTSYYKGTEQCSRRARFLILMQLDSLPIGKGNLRGCVRKVALRQFGHFMMGTARIGGQSITLSGAYGHDGLPTTVSENIWKYGKDIPDSLYDLWNNGGGWNSCGSEAPSMREWALNNFPEK